MGDQGVRRYDGRVRRYFTPRCIGLHVTLLVVLPAFAWLTNWQLGRALGGNALSWAYTFEWPLFAGYACYMWWQLIHDVPTDAARRTAPAPESGDAVPDHLQPGWALTGGRKKNVAIAASTTIDDQTGGRGERYRPQTTEEAAALARYNRHLAELDVVDRAPAARVDGSGTDRGDGARTGAGAEAESGASSR
jgi:hypothetical protein